MFLLRLQTGRGRLHPLHQGQSDAVSERLPQVSGVGCGCGVQQGWVRRGGVRQGEVGWGGWCVGKGEKYGLNRAALKDGLHHSELEGGIGECWVV